jgi:two-component system, OmpR family, sensor histidine kinase ArlS
MHIRTRIALLFSGITATLLLIFAGIIFFSAAQNRENTFYQLLHQEGITKANLFFNSDIPAETLQEIYLSNRETIYEVEVAIYDASFDLQYHDAVEIDYVKEDEPMLQAIRFNKWMSFYEGNWQVVGFVFENAGQEYLVTAAAFDEYGFNKLKVLRNVLVISGLIATLLLFVLGRFFSALVLSPIRQITARARKISAKNLDMRLEVGKSQDELNELSETFNHMLSRLEDSFEAQKNIVSHIAHELRTPLSALISELELAGNRAEDKAALLQAIHTGRSDAQRMNKLISNLLDLAKADMDQAMVQFKILRLDELVLGAVGRVLQSHPDYLCPILMDEDSEDSTPPKVRGNEYLLQVALMNLIENACKYSPNKTAKISIHKTGHAWKIIIKNEGIGIAEGDIQQLSRPFFRGKSSAQSVGYGIGLALVEKILRLHQTKAEITSDGTSWVEASIVLA